MNLPVISHPMSQVGERPTFSVQGLSQLPRHSYSRQGAPSFVHSSFPQLADQRKGHSKKLNSLTDRRTRDERKGKFQKPFVVYSNLDELEALVQEKVTTGLHGVKCMFKANDPMGLGTVSREAFLKIICNLVGYISVDQFSRLLRRLGLEGKSNISFEEFMLCFKENEHIEREWIIPLQLMRTKEQDHYPNPEKSLREDMTYRDGFISVPLCLDLLKQKVRQRGFRVTDYLPHMKRDEDGRVLPPQLAQFLEKLGLRVTEEDFKSLWDRYDTEGVGAIKATQFFRMVGLDESGTPRPATTDSFFSLRSSRRGGHMHPYGKGRKKVFLQRVTKKLDEESQREASVEEAEAEVTPEENQNDVVVSRRKPSKTKRTPKLDNVVDALKYKFEQSYQAMLKGMQCFDVRGEGLIARIDLHKVLEEFGFSTLVTDMPQFLTRCGIKATQGELIYSELLDRFWNRSEAGFVHRILEKRIESAMHRGEGRPHMAGERLTVEELEQHLVEFIHRHFITLSASLRKCDYNRLGVIPQYEFREAIETSLGHQMTEDQWSSLREQAVVDDDGLVPYKKFMETFLDSPGAWNKRDHFNVMVRKVRPIETPSVVERLRARAQLPGEWEGDTRLDEAATDRRTSAMDGRSTRMEQEDRSPEQLTEIVQDLFKKRFYEIDKAFRDLDRKMTGRCNKQQFAELLKSCDIELTLKEVDALWEMVETSADNMVTFSKLVSRFAGHLVKRPTPQSTDDATQREVSAFHKVHSWVVSRPSSTMSNVVKADLLRLIRADVLGQWDQLRQIFKNLDKTLTATVPTGDMKEVMKLFHFHLAEEEMEALVNEFDLRADGSFHYIEFMKNFAKKRPHHRATRVSAGYLGRVVEVAGGDLGYGTEVNAGGQGHGTEGGGLVTKTDSVAGQ